MVQNKEFCPSCLISQEPYIRWLSFMGQMCKMIISPGFFFNFKVLIFGLSRGWKGKKWPKMTKNSVCWTLYFRNHVSYDLPLWYTCMYKRIKSSGIFFFKVLIFRIIGGGGHNCYGWIWHFLAKKASHKIEKHL